MSKTQVADRTDSKSDVGYRAQQLSEQFRDMRWHGAERAGASPLKSADP